MIFYGIEIDLSAFTAVQICTNLKALHMCLLCAVGKCAFFFLWKLFIYYFVVSLLFRDQFNGHSALIL